MIQLKENARIDGRKDGQTLFYRTLPAIAGVQKIAKATGDLIGNKITDKIINISKKSSRKLHSTELRPQYNEANDEIETPTERYISPEERQQIIDELKLVPKNC